MCCKYKRIRGVKEYRIIRIIRIINATETAYVVN